MDYDEIVQTHELKTLEKNKYAKRELVLWIKIFKIK